MSPQQMVCGFGRLTERTFLEVLHTVYANRDVKTLQTLCTVSRTVSRLTEGLMYSELEVYTTENLGQLAFISNRQKALIKSLTLVDRDLTYHSKLDLVWGFIASLPNLERLDIQYAVIPWVPPPSLRLPKLHTVRMRIIGNVKDFSLAERLHYIHHSAFKASDPMVSPLPRCDLPLEEPGWISKMTEQLPNLQTLSILFLGPLVGILRRMGQRSDANKLDKLRNLEVILSENQVEEVPSIVHALAGEAENLAVLQIRGKNCLMNWSSSERKASRAECSTAYIRPIRLANLRHMLVDIERQVQPCQSDMDDAHMQPKQLGDPNHHLPDVFTFHRQVQEYFNDNLQLRSYAFQVSARPDPHHPRPAGTLDPRPLPPVVIAAFYIGEVTHTPDPTINDTRRKLFIKTGKNSEYALEALASDMLGTRYRPVQNGAGSWKTFAFETQTELATLNGLCIDYGGQQDLVTAFRGLHEQHLAMQTHNDNRFTDINSDEEIQERTWQTRPPLPGSPFLERAASLRARLDAEDIISGDHEQHDLDEASAEMDQDALSVISDDVDEVEEGG